MLSLSMLTTHVVSQGLAEELKRNGWPQEGSTFYWSVPMPERANNEKERLVLSNQCEVELCHKWTDWGDKFQNVAAPLASELGEVLPDECPQHGGSLNIRRGFGKWLVGYGEHQEFKGCHVEVEDTEADARAKMWLYLKKEGLLK